MYKHLCAIWLLVQTISSDKPRSIVKGRHLQRVAPCTQNPQSLPSPLHFVAFKAFNCQRNQQFSGQKDKESCVNIFTSDLFLPTPAVPCGIL